MSGLLLYSLAFIGIATLMAVGFIAFLEFAEWMAGKLDDWRDGE